MPGNNRNTEEEAFIRAMQRKRKKKRRKDLGMISFRSLSLKSFFAGLTGLCMPYWLFFGYAFYYDKMKLASFQPFTGVSFFFNPFSLML